MYNTHVHIIQSLDRQDAVHYRPILLLLRLSSHVGFTACRIHVCMHAVQIVTDPTVLLHFVARGSNILSRLILERYVDSTGIPPVS